MSSGEGNPAKETVLDQVKNTVLKFIPASRKVLHLVDQLESGEIRMQPSKAIEKKFLEQQAFQTRKIVFALFGTGLLISGAQIFAVNDLAGMIMMVSGSLMTILQAGRNSSPRRRRPHPKFGGRGH